MNIQLINGPMGLYQNFGQNNKQSIIGKLVSKAIVSSSSPKVASEIPAATATTPTIETTSFQVVQPDSDIFTKDNKSDDNIETTTTQLKSGTVRTDKIKRDVLAGTFIESDFNPPLNGVAKMKMYKNPTGDISSIKTFDKDGKILKNISYNRDFNSYWHNGHKPQSIDITDEQGNVTTIYNEFLNHRPTEYKAVTIVTPDGEIRKTVVPHSMADKVKDKAVDLQWKTMQSINARKHILR